MRDKGSGAPLSGRQCAMPLLGERDHGRRGRFTWGSATTAIFLAFSSLPQSSPASQRVIHAQDAHVALPASRSISTRDEGLDISASCSHPRRGISVTSGLGESSWRDLRGCQFDRSSQPPGAGMSKMRVEKVGWHQSSDRHVHPSVGIDVPGLRHTVERGGSMRSLTSIERGGSMRLRGGDAQVPGEGGLFRKVSLFGGAMEMTIPSSFDDMSRSLPHPSPPTPHL